MIKSALILFLVSIALIQFVEGRESETRLSKLLNRKRRVSGGQNAEISEFPSLVHLTLSGNSRGSVCGGIIIAPEHVLTAAHCVAGLKEEQITITYGTDPAINPGKTVKVKKITNHPHYNKDSNSPVNDISILETLTFELQPGSVEIAKLPEDDVEFGKQVNFAGWGLEKGENLRQFQKLSARTMSAAKYSKDKPEQTAGCFTSSGSSKTGENTEETEIGRFLFKFDEKDGRVNQGDSGSGLYDGKVVVGVHARAKSARKNDKDIKCGAVSFAMNVHFYKGFILATVPKLSAGQSNSSPTSSPDNFSRDSVSSWGSGEYDQPKDGSSSSVPSGPSKHEPLVKSDGNSPPTLVARAPEYAKVNKPKKIPEYENTKETKKHA